MTTILVVDDDALLRREMREGLEHAGYSVHEACNGREALQLFDKTHPAVIITDILMPDTDGIELVRTLRRQGADVKIIAVSNSGSFFFPGYLKHAETFGADRTIEKPIDIAQLLTDVRAFTRTSDM